jgi:hypothetical protein
MKLLDFSAKSNTTVTVRFIPDVHDAGGAAALLNTGPSDFGGHAQGGFDARTNLQGRGGSEKESAAGDVQSLGEMLGLVRDHAYGAKAQRRPRTEPCDLSAFSALCRRFHDGLPPFGAKVAGARGVQKGEFGFQRSKGSAPVKY